MVKQKYKDFAYIDADAFDLGIQELKDKSFDMGDKIDEIRKAIKVYTFPQNNDDDKKKTKLKTIKRKESWDAFLWSTRYRQN